MLYKLFNTETGNNLNFPHFFFFAETPTKPVDQVTKAPEPGEPHPPIPSCEWTQWMNSHRRIPGDVRETETLSQLRMYYDFCEFPSQIECRDAKTGQMFDKTGDLAVTCDINHGLICEDLYQNSAEGCRDYEVRVYCTDGCQSTVGPTVSPRCEPGWTDWINNVHPSSDFPTDVEVPRSILGYPDTCNNVIAVRCSVVATGLDYKSKGENVICTTNGLKCTPKPGETCEDYQVQFYCDCKLWSKSTDQTFSLDMLRLTALFFLMIVIYVRDIYEWNLTVSY